MNISVQNMQKIWITQDQAVHEAILMTAVVLDLMFRNTFKNQTSLIIKLTRKLTPEPKYSMNHKSHGTTVQIVEKDIFRQVAIFNILSRGTTCHFFSIFMDHLSTKNLI